MNSLGDHGGPSSVSVSQREVSWSCRHSPIGVASSVNRRRINGKKENPKIVIFQWISFSQKNIGNRIKIFHSDEHALTWLVFKCGVSTALKATCQKWLLFEKTCFLTFISPWCIRLFVWGGGRGCVPEIGHRSVAKNPSVSKLQISSYIYLMLRRYAREFV